MPIVSVERLMKELGITERWVHRLVEAGMPRASHGKYDLHLCFRWYIRFLQGAVRKRSLFSEEAGEKSLTQEKIRLLSAEADLKEIELAKQRGQLVAVDDVEKEVTELVLTTKARLMAIPARLAAEVIGETTRVSVQVKIEKHIKEVLRGLARSSNKSIPPNHLPADNEQA